jgi:uncharacterized protein
VSGVAQSARRAARPVPGRRLPGALPAARLAGKLAPSSARTIVSAPRSGSAEQVAPVKRALLVTYRRDGRAVPTPVWAALTGGRLYVRSERAAGKVKRLRADPRLLIAPCTVRGVALGAPFEAYGRVLPVEGEELAERTLSKRYGLGRELFERTMDLLRVDMCFLELTPRAWNKSNHEGTA